MSRSTHLELHATDSQALDPPDSVSLPSEPPDIRKWFSSYIYESPELNTFDGFGDFNGSGEICLEEKKEREFGENRPVGKPDDGLLSTAKKSSDWIVKCDESVSSAAMVAEEQSANSSFWRNRLFEPPDIKNWFSSYLYESPPLDATDDFTIFDYKDSEDGKLSTAQESCRKVTKDVMDFIHVEESTELLSHNRKSDVVVKCADLVNCTNLDGQSVCKDSHNVHLKRLSSTPSQLTSKMVSKLMLPRQETGNHDHCFGGKFGNGKTYGKTYNLKLDCSLIDNTIPELLNMENNPGSQVGKSLHKSIGTKNCVKDSLVKEELHETVSAGALDLTEPKGDSWRRPTNRRSTGKENNETNLLGNGFISTKKKSSQANTGNVPRHVLVQTRSFRNEIKPAVNTEKDAKTSRKVLSETSNFHSPNVMESTGKWRCPQKNKPNLGPPLKQLRLEQWVRRV
ncbi:hypothetical protein Salat_0650900 [Sesamum alatum]|uniref:Uncharacterized protein n=1 Tax=Sesamum alatum TaxID=300844 RepID=A0AAE1YQQ3_9LAMI|nr:hypothetical protein Salat_0650900 [Sesamum alatum]